jgi:hypothetical protein
VSKQLGQRQGAQPLAFPPFIDGFSVPDTRRACNQK